MQIYLNILCFILYFSLPNVSSELPNGNRFLMEELNLISQMLATYSQFNFRIQRSCRTADILFPKQLISHSPNGNLLLSKFSCLTHIYQQFM
jgi:hypothetical protein